MTIINSIQKLYNGNLTLLGVNKRLYNEYGNTSAEEVKLLNRLASDNDQFLDYLDEDEVDCGAACDRVGFLKNFVAYGEVTTYKGEYLREMDPEKRDLAVKKMIRELPNLYEPPTAYEIKEDNCSVVLCFIIEPICKLSEIDTIIATGWREAYNLEREFDIEKAEKEMDEYGKQLELEDNLGL